jgi:hypothetical protein
MKRLKAFGLVCAGAAIVGCAAADPNSDKAEVRTTSETIKRSTSNGGRDQVVMIYAEVRLANGNIGTRTCTGSYFAPRVVLTAAHCLTDIFDNQLVVYFGDNFATDFSAEVIANGPFLTVPAPGQPSHFSQADSFEIHPQYDANSNYPDMGVVYLDRKPPFDPLPLFRSRLDNSWLNKTVTVTGWGADTAPTPTTGAGARVERTGTTKFLGSPTAADYHADDPNPGMLNATVRNNTFKLDGHAPNASPCFGDSGGPIIINQFGQDYIGGVGFWVGLSCEDYSIFSRLDPFLPFLDEAYKKGGQETLIPALDCVAPNVSGGYTAYFDYNNKNGVAVTIPYGTKNQLALDVSSHRPTKFLPGGEQDFVFGVDFTASQTLTWTLSPDNSPKTTLNVTKNSLACSASKAPLVACGSACRAQEKSGCTDQLSYPDCMDNCKGTDDFFVQNYPTCRDEFTAYNTCLGTVPPGLSNWICQDGFVPDAAACSDQENTLINCLYGG